MRRERRVGRTYIDDGEFVDDGAEAISKDLLCVTDNPCVKGTDARDRLCSCPMDDGGSLPLDLGQTNVDKVHRGRNHRDTLEVVRWHFCGATRGMSHRYSSPDRVWFTVGIDSDEGCVYCVWGSCAEGGVLGGE